MEYGHFQYMKNRLKRVCVHAWPSSRKRRANFTIPKLSKSQNRAELAPRSFEFGPRGLEDPPSDTFPNRRDRILINIPIMRSYNTIYIIYVRTARG